MTGSPARPAPLRQTDADELAVRRALDYAGPMARQGGGRVNAVFRLGDRVAKLYRPNGGTPLFPNDPDAEWRALLALAPAALAPRPLYRTATPRGDLITYAHIPGDPGCAQPAAVAGLLGRLHSQAPWRGLRQAVTGPMIDGAAAGMIADTDPLHGHRPPQAAAAPIRQTPIHRDPVPANIISGRQKVCLIDYQCPALGDPAEDLAHFLSPAMQLLYGQGPLSATDIAAFLMAYPHADIRDHYARIARSLHWRMACYCQWQHDQGNGDYAAARDAEIAFLSRL